MKKIINYIFGQFKYLFVNPFWRNWFILICLISSFASSAAIWYLYLTKYGEILNLTPIAFSGGVLLVNLFLAVIVYPKEKNVSYILIVASLLVQLFMLFFIKMTVQSGAFG